MALTRITQGGAPQGSMVSSRPGPAAYGPVPGGRLGFAQGQYDQAAKTFQQYSQQPGLLPVFRQQAQQAMQGWGGQVRQLQAEQRKQQQAAQKAAKAATPQAPAAAQPATPLAAPPAQPAAQVPDQPAATQAVYAPPEQPAQAPTNPLLAALQGSTFAQGTTNTNVNALSRAIGGIGSAGPGTQNQEAFLKRLRSMLTTGTV